MNQWVKGVRPWSSVPFWGGKDLVSLSLRFLRLFLVVAFPACLGGGDSPGAKTGVVASLSTKNRMCKSIFSDC